MHVFNNNKPLYMQLKEVIELSILNDLLKPEEAVPSIRILAKDYQINPLTVTAAIDALVVDGILFTRRGIGTFVSSNAKMRIKEQQLENFKNSELIATLLKAKSLGMVLQEVENIVNNVYGGKK